MTSRGEGTSALQGVAGGGGRNIYYNCRTPMPNPADPTEDVVSRLYAQHAAASRSVCARSGPALPATERLARSGVQRETILEEDRDEGGFADLKGISVVLTLWNS